MRIHVDQCGVHSPYQRVLPSVYQPVEVRGTGRAEKRHRGDRAFFVCTVLRDEAARVSCAEELYFHLCPAALGLRDRAAVFLPVPAEPQTPDAE